MDKKQFFRTKIIKYGTIEKVNYSWRKKISPYRVLISEVMLKRTQTIQVDKIFTDFIKKYPNINALSNADEKTLLEIIKPLGFHNQRLKIFQKLPKELKKYANKVPDNFEDLKKIYGVGDYTANAILCFAFNKRSAIIETNIIRIFKRFFGITSKKKSPETDKTLWQFSDSILPSEEYSLFNFTMMVFGIKICRSNKPLCNDCLLKEECNFYNSRTK